MVAMGKMYLPGCNKTYLIRILFKYIIIFKIMIIIVILNLIDNEFNKIFIEHNYYQMLRIS